MTTSDLKNKTKQVMPKKGKATVLSQKVADVLMNLRQSRQMSQRAFAEHIGVSFQQYQKYEKGRDRLSLEKAMLLCSQLDLPLSVFMDDEYEVIGFAETEQAAFQSSAQSTGKAKSADKASPLNDNEKEILDIFTKIPEQSREDFLETLRQLAKMTSTKS